MNLSQQAQYHLRSHFPVRAAGTFGNPKPSSSAMAELVRAGLCVEVTRDGFDGKPETLWNLTAEGSTARDNDRAGRSYDADAVVATVLATDLVAAGAS